MRRIEELYSYYSGTPKVSIDTRTIDGPCIFFALHGENFNANKFAADALDKGAVLAVIDDPDYDADERFFLVEDTLKCLQDLAVYHRKQLDVPVVGITGTNGKTTSKELISRVLSQKFKVHSTKGNYNNHIGVPLTLLDANSEHEILVVEMGANHIGEIKELCKIADPDTGAITNIGRAHLEGFGSYEGVIKAKSELYDHLTSKEGSTIILNADDKVLTSLLEDFVGERITYSFENAGNINVKSIYADPLVHFSWRWNELEFSVDTSMIGTYNVNNMLMAMSFGLFFGVEPEQINRAIETYVPDNNRSQLIKDKNKTIILDAYNANPSSMKASLSNFEEVVGDKKLAILGDMFEMGEYAESEHKGLIEHVKENLSFEAVFVGAEFAKCEGDKIFETVDELSEYLLNIDLSGYTILIKGSRGIGLERILPQIKDEE